MELINLYFCRALMPDFFLFFCVLKFNYMTGGALYRKYRPKNFSEIIGQEHIVKTLMNSIISGNISHAYLFSGPRGTGKTTMARVFAKAINCLNRKENEAEPCNKCQSCLDINNNQAIDLIEIDAASNRGIDEIRELKESISFLPVKSKYKVFVIDEAHQLTKDAANALLKTLEEPPAHAVFILATTEPHKMIPTIISRCQRFDFRRLTADKIKEKLKLILEKEKIKYDEEALNLISLAANGALRDAETILDEIISFSGEEGKVKKEIAELLLGLSDRKIILEFLNYLGNKKLKEGINFLEDIMYKGVDLGEFIKSVNNYLREILLTKIEASFESFLLSQLEKKEKEKINVFYKNLSVEEIKRMIDILLEAEKKMKYSSIIQLPLELAVVEICRP